MTNTRNGTHGHKQHAPKKNRNSSKTRSSVDNGSKHASTEDSTPANKSKNGNRNKKNNNQNIRNHNAVQKNHQSKNDVSIMHMSAAEIAALATHPNNTEREKREKATGSSEAAPSSPQREDRHHSPCSNSSPPSSDTSSKSRSRRNSSSVTASFDQPTAAASSVGSMRSGSGSHDDLAAASTSVSTIGQASSSTSTILSTAACEARTRRFLPHSRLSISTSTTTSEPRRPKWTPPPVVMSPTAPFVARPVKWGGRQLLGAAPTHPYRGNSCPPCPPQHKLRSWWSIFANVATRGRGSNTHGRSNASKRHASHDITASLSYAELLQYTPKFLLSRRYHDEYHGAGCSGLWVDVQTASRGTDSVSDHNHQHTNIFVHFSSLCRPVFKGFHPGYVHYWTTPPKSCSSRSMVRQNQLVSFIKDSQALPCAKHTLTSKRRHEPQNNVVQSQRNVTLTASSTFTHLDSTTASTAHERKQKLEADKTKQHNGQTPGVGAEGTVVVHSSLLTSLVLNSDAAEDHGAPSYDHSRGRFDLFSRAKEQAVLLSNSDSAAETTDKNGNDEEVTPFSAVQDGECAVLPDSPQPPSPVRTDWVTELVCDISGSAGCAEPDQQQKIEDENYEPLQEELSSSNDRPAAVPEVLSEEDSKESQGPKVLVAQLAEKLSDKTEYIKKLKGRIKELRDERDDAKAQAVKADDALMQLQYTYDLNKKSTTRTLESTSRLSEENAALRLKIEELQDALSEQVTGELLKKNSQTQLQHRLSNSAVHPSRRSFVDGVTQTNPSLNPLCTECHSYRSQRDAAIANLKNSSRSAEEEKLRIDSLLADKTKEIQAKVAGDLARMYKVKLNEVEAQHKEVRERAIQEQREQSYLFVQKHFETQKMQMDQKMTTFDDVQRAQMNRMMQSRYGALKATYEQELMVEKGKYHRLQLRYEEEMREENGKIIKLTKEVDRLRDRGLRAEHGNSINHHKSEFIDVVNYQARTVQQQPSEHVTKAAAPGRAVNPKYIYNWMLFLMGLQRMKHETELKEQKLRVVSLQNEHAADMMQHDSIIKGLSLQVNEFRDAAAAAADAAMKAAALQEQRRSALHDELMVLEHRTRNSLQSVECNARRLLFQLFYCEREMTDYGV